MKHPTLFDVPKDSPSLREKITAFKQAHGICTFHNPNMHRKDQPWLALVKFAQDTGMQLDSEKRWTFCGVILKRF